jgi:hypothetical protein
MKPAPPKSHNSPANRRAPRVAHWPSDAGAVHGPNRRAQINPIWVSIARITDDELLRMSAADLSDLLRFSALTSQFSQCTDFLRELPQSGKSGLHLLAMLARRRCRDEINSICESRGFPLPKYARPSR